MSHYLFTSESVSKGHPDKIADQIADAILDACLTEDPQSRVSCELLVTTGLIIIAGEITTKAVPDYRQITREVIQEIGYDDSSMGFDYRSFGFLVTLNRQSPDISRGVTPGEGLYAEPGAGDQGLMFGFACDETPELMPLPIMLAHRLQFELLKQKRSGALPYLRPDAKSQVTVEYTEDHTPVRIHTVVLSTQHSPEVDHATVQRDMIQMIQDCFPPALLDSQTLYHINPTGRFVVGGPESDCGLTGRKLMVDTYGGMSRHGGGCFSGKDATKVDRSGAYAMRYVAKNIVAAKLARRCEVQVAYAIGVPHPVSIKVDTFGTGSVSEEALSHAIPQVFNLSAQGIIDMLQLCRPIFLATAFGGHFGRELPSFTWERTDRVAALRAAVGLSKS